MKKVKSKLTNNMGRLDFDSKEGTLSVAYYDLYTKELIINNYKSLEDLCEEWEDYEEPKVYYYISDFGAIRECEIGKFPEDEEDRKRIGNYFETKEEAEKAVEKLKAWKRLKDNGMIKYSFNIEKRGIDLDFYTLTILAPRDKDSLDLLFGGEE